MERGGRVEDAFKRSRTGRSSIRGSEKEESEMSEIMRRWKEDMEEIMKKIKGIQKKDERS